MIGGGASGSTRGLVKAGTFVYVAHANDPGDSVGDYLECNGQNVSRTTYAVLFGKIGTIWGVGDGGTTFTLPDSRRRSPVGKGGVGTGTLGNAVGNTGGEETHTQTNAEAPALTHAHGLDGQTIQGSVSTQPTAVTDTNIRSLGTATLNASPGGGGAFNEYSPVYVCGVWIKT